jgi:hypothetical protein
VSLAILWQAGINKDIRSCATVVLPYRRSTLKPGRMAECLELSVAVAMFQRYAVAAINVSRKPAP